MNKAELPHTTCLHNRRSYRLPTLTRLPRPAAVNDLTPTKNAVELAV